MAVEEKSAKERIADKQREDLMRDFNALVGGIIGYLVVVVALALLRAWTLSVLWGWLVVPLFGLRGLNLVRAYAITLLLGFLLPPVVDWDRKKVSTATSLYRSTGMTVIGCAISLGAGYVVHLFV